MYLDIARRLFVKEVEVVQKLGNHKRIPTLLDSFEENDQFYLVQEYIEGRSPLEELTIYIQCPLRSLLGEGVLLVALLGTSYGISCKVVGFLLRLPRSRLCLLVLAS